MNIVKEVGDIFGEVIFLYRLGCVFEILDFFEEKVLGYYKFSVEVFNGMRSFVFEDVFKISFCEIKNDVYIVLWRILLKFKRVEEVLFVVE